jgi:hypothetical protein
VIVLKTNVVIQFLQKLCSSILNKPAIFDDILAKILAFVLKTYFVIHFLQKLLSFFEHFMPNFFAKIL